MHEDPRAGGTDLTLVEEETHGRAANCSLDTRVAENDLRRLASEFEHDALEGLRSNGTDSAANLRTARETDLVDVRVLNECLTGRATEPGHDVDHAVGHARLGDQGREMQDRQRGVFGRLHDQRVASGKCRRDLPRGDHQRSVPRHNGTDDADQQMSDLKSAFDTLMYPTSMLTPVIYTFDYLSARSPSVKHPTPRDGSKRPGTPASGLGIFQIQSPALRRPKVIVHLAQAPLSPKPIRNLQELCPHTGWGYRVGLPPTSAGGSGRAAGGRRCHARRRGTRR